MRCPLRREYHAEYPSLSVYSTDWAEGLRPLLDKADVWKYEREYRLITQERSVSNTHGTLMTDNQYLKLPEDA